MTPLFEELPYRPDSTALFDILAEEEWSLFLDSGRPHGVQGRYDILCADPAATVTSRAGRFLVMERGASSPTSIDDLFNWLRPHLQASSMALPAPFAGGAAGYLGYDYGRRLEGLPVPASSIPELALGIYDWAVVVDHMERRSWMVGMGREPRTRQRWRERAAQFRSAREPRPRAFAAAGGVTCNLDFETYASAFLKVQRYIRDGDCYQVNLARRFSVPVEGSPWEAYQRLRRMNPAPFGAYLNLPDFQVLSTSPERFISVDGRHVVTQPIKGTRPRAKRADEDAALARSLSQSAKDRAENLMIVDLLRNDLGKSCEPGSIEVPALFKVESFSTVHHLVSTVTGKLTAECDALDLLAGALPGGSITGAPKRRAMEIIELLEPHRREVYCGAIGYLGAGGRVDTNVAIRTMIHQKGEMRFWAGGGIVADSVLEEEFLETEHKIAGIRRLFE